jgi:bifunctional DNA-binding transcriptional regulator/antitoxin component of YhaV-PrlF toxin-antitoxin module
MRSIVTISNRNTLVLPKYVLEALGAKAGEKVAFAVEGKTVRLIHVTEAEGARVDQAGKGPTA